MDYMSIKPVINNKRYLVSCYVEGTKKIVVEAKEIANSGSNTIYKKYLKENLVLNTIGLTTKLRLEWEMKKAMKFVNKKANENNGLTGAIKHIDGIYNLDQHMDL